MGNYKKIADEIAALVSEKNKAYGDAFAKTGKILQEMYPDGVGIDQYGDMLAIVRVLDKLFRIATNRDAFGESPWKDIMGYALLSLDRQRRKEFDGYIREEYGLTPGKGEGTC